MLDALLWAVDRRTVPRKARVEYGQAPAIRHRTRLALLVILLNAFDPECPADAALILRTQEKPLAQVADTADLANVQISRDQRHVAFPVRRNGRWVMSVDGREGQAYRKVFRPAWSSDGQHVAYAVMDDDACYVILDGKRGKAHEGIHENYLGFTPQGEIVYIANDANNVFVVRGDRELAAHEFVPGSKDIDPTTLRVSPDGTHISYVFIAPGEQRVIIDGKAEPPQPVVSGGGVWFSPDGQQSVYAFHKDKKSYLVLNGIQRPELYEGIAPLGSLLPGESYSPESYSPFSPDGRHLVFVAWTLLSERRQCVVFDHRPGKHYGAIGANSIVFSPDSKRWAYYAEDSAGLRVVLDGEEQPIFDAVQKGSLVFSPDSSQFAYIAARKGTHYLVLNGKEQAIPGLLPMPPVFSPDGKHLVYVRAVEGKLFLVAGEAESKPYEVVKHPLGDMFFGNWRVVFDTANTFHFIGGRFNEAFAYEFSLGEGELLEAAKAGK